MSVPVTKEDFAKIGRRFNSDDLVHEIDRLLPMALADQATLETGGYSRAMLDELAAFRDQLRAETAAKTEIRGAKKGARESETLAFKEGRWVLRKGISMALVALARRQPPAGEAPKTTQERVAELHSKVQALSGTLNNNPALLRSRMEGLRAILGQPDFAPGAGGEAARTAFLARLEGAIALITTHAEAKKHLKQSAKGKTETVDELDGRAYTNLRLLAQVGRSSFMDAGDRLRADAYSLRQLNHRRGTKGKAEPEPASPVSPSPAPSPSSPGPALPRPSAPAPAPMPVG
jgi:hypothetical protein